MKLKYSITFAILSIIVAAIASMGILAGISLYTHKMRDDMDHQVHLFERANVAIETLKIEFLMARRAEKDFLLRLDPKYIERHADVMRKMEAHLDTLQALQPELPQLTITAERLPLLAGFAAQYEAHFQDVASSNETLGLTNGAGLRSVLHNSRAALRDSAIDSGELGNQLRVSELIEIENHFLLTANEEVQGLFQSAVSNLQNELAKDDLGDAFTTNLASYAAAFDALVTETQKERGFRKLMSARFADAEPHMNAVLQDILLALDDVLIEAQEVSGTAQSNAVIAAVIASVIFTLFALLLARSISLPLAKISNILKDLMQDDFSKPVPTSRIRELSSIGEVVDVLRKSEETKAHLAREISGVIEACSEGDFSRRITVGEAEGVFAEIAKGVNDIGKVAEKGLGDVKVALEIIATGDLSHEMPSGHKGTFKVISDSLNSLTNNLDGMVRQLNNSSQILNNTSHEISSSVEHASRRGEITATSIEETSSSLKTVAHTVDQTARSAQEARNHVNDAQSKAEATQVVAHKTVAAIQKIKHSSDAISQVSELIEDVAFQTNLLALNAGVEAARAGDAGRGFAVVASEVRALAQRSTEAAHEINTLISSSQAEVANGVDLMNETGEALGDILRAVEHVVGKVSVIAENAAAQSNSLAEVNAAVESLDSDSQKNAAMLEETAASGQVLKVEATGLVEAIAGFELKSGEGQSIIIEGLMGTAA